ncbi:MAG: NAD(P)/FAD-dependent oxidoreductase [Dehalococcoidia bacterium]|nr:MAG: NAD(P)/FAD-dependent oxidoreductase [Dehalococcoidia bacterium]
MERKTCDSVVIGSGIGGMCAAAKLAYSGYKTIVIEKLPMLGGRFTQIEYKGYQIPTAAWMILYGKNDPVYLTLNEVQAPEIETVSTGAIPQIYRLGGKDHKMEGKGALRDMISWASRDKEEEEKVMTALKRAILWYEPPDTITFHDWLLQYTESKTVRDLFQCLVAAWAGANSWEVTAGQWFRVLKGMTVGGNPFILKNGVKDVTDALEKVIKDNGSEIFTKTRAKKILIEEGFAKGIAADVKGEAMEIEAKIVISNAGPKRTIDLGGQENFDRAYLKEVEKKVRPAQGVDYMITSNEPLMGAPTVLFTADTRRLECFVGDCTPDGKYIVRTASVPESAMQYSPKEEYEVFLQDLKETFPDFDKCGGKILVARNFCGDWPFYGTWPGDCLTQKTPIENLYNVGDAVIPGGWVGGSGAAASAAVVVDDIKARVKPV